LEPSRRQTREKKAVKERGGESQTSGDKKSNRFGLQIKKSKMIKEWRKE
jgi:hypothetical protein